MSKNNVLINLGLVVSMLFCMAFACSDGDERSGETETRAAQPETRTATAGGALTERDVREYFADTYAHYTNPTTFVFDSPIKIAAPTRHTFGDGSTFNCYPVKVDYTATADLGGSFKTSHYTRGIYYFYRNSFDEWEASSEGYRSTDEYKQK